MPSKEADPWQLQPSAANSHGRDWQSTVQYLRAHCGKSYVNDWADAWSISHFKVFKVRGRTCLSFSLQHGDEDRGIQFYEALPGPDCGVLTAWRVDVRHSRVRCSNCELERERSFNRRASKNYWMRNGLIKTPLFLECQHCGQRFQPKRSNARFCSARCRVASHRQRQTTY